MSKFRFDRRDVDFSLYNHLQIEELLELPRYADFDRQTLEIIFDNAQRFAEERLAPHSQEADAEGCRLEDGEVQVPQCYEELHEEFCEMGLFSPVHNPELGGMGLPHALGVALIEMFIGANGSFMFTPGLTSSAAHLIEEYGTEEDVELYCEKMFTGQWAGTMCLTEPQAGSSLGALTTAAEPVDGEDYFHVSGNKIFISAGDHQLTDNIVHLVLARVDGDPEGTKGLSLFIVPKRRAGDDGAPGEPNDVTVTGIEEKMGIHASPTCSLSFGDDGDCRGWLVGERCQGLTYMFQMMNEARIVTGLQGVALGNAAFQDALAYARERQQGPKVTDRSDDKKSVPIIEHPDVRRNLMTMKAYGEAIRALSYNTAYISDIANYSSGEESDRAQGLVDLLTPVCKAFCSDIGFRMTELAMQVYGGYGYIKEYGVEQKMRDVKIASIYEGTNGIQALDLLGRKMRRNGGALFMNWVHDASQFLGKWTEDEVFGELATEVDEAKNTLSQAALGFQAQGKEDPEMPLLHATPFLRMFGHVESARLLLEQATTARAELEQLWSEHDIDDDDRQARAELADQHEDVRYFENKIHTASFFVYQLLPKVQRYLTSIESGDRSALEVAL